MLILLICSYFSFKALTVIKTAFQVVKSYDYDCYDSVIIVIFLEIFSILFEVFVLDDFI